MSGALGQTINCRWLAPVARWLAFVALLAPSACSPSPNGELPKLSKFAQALPDALPKPKPTVSAAAIPATGTIADVLKKRRGCTTTIVKKLSEQIIAEGNCVQPGAYVRVPMLANATFGKAVFPYMRKAALDAFIAALRKAKRRKIKVNSMLRTVAQQYLLYDWYRNKRCGIKLAAVPGNSNHQSGLAIDISQPGSWRKTLKKQGFRWMGKRDRWHFDYVNKKTKKLVGLDIEAFQRLWNRNHPSEPLDEHGEFDEQTERALRRAPIRGFMIGARCSKD